MRSLVDWLSRLERPVEGRLLLGVCAAVARAAQLDVTLVRLALVILGLASGVGVLVYLLLWLLTPLASTAPAGLPQTMRANLEHLPQDLKLVADGIVSAWSQREQGAWSRPGTRRWVGVGLIVGGVVLLLYSLGLFSWLGPLRLLGLAVIVVGASMLLNMTPLWRR